MQSSTDSTEWQVANRQWSLAIELQREKVQELGLQARQRKLDDAARLLEPQKEKVEKLDRKEKVRELERRKRQHQRDTAARERQRQRDDAARLQQAERLAAIGLRKEKRAAAFELQREKDQEILRQELQHRLEQRRIKEQLEAVREEKARLDSLAIVERDRELWRLQEEARANKILGQKRLRTGSGIRPRGAHKRSVATQQATEPCAKRTLLGVEDSLSRYSLSRYSSLFSI
jgi:hypothetical protein